MRETKLTIIPTTQFRKVAKARVSGRTLRMREDEGPGKHNGKKHGKKRDFKRKRRG